VTANHDFQSVTREVITGDGVGYAGPMGTPHVVRDVITGHVQGALYKYQTAMKEVITGEGIGFEGPLRAQHIVKEIICRDATFRFAVTHTEVLGQIVGEDLVVRWTARTAHQQIARHVPRTPAPAMWSRTDVPVFRELVGQRNARPAPHSVESVPSLQHQTAQRRVSAPPAQVLSTLTMFTVNSLVAVSRTIPYNPVSGNFTYTTHQQVALDRGAVVAPADARGPIIVPAVRELIALSRRAGYDNRVQQVFQLVARQKIVTFSAPTSVAADVQQVAQERVVPTPAEQRSPMFAYTEQMQAAQHRPTPGIIWSPITVFTVSGLLAQQRTHGGIHHSVTTVFTDVQQIAQHRDTSDPADAFGPMHVPSAVQLVARERELLPQPYTKEFVQSTRLLVAQHREALPPNATSDWRVGVQMALVAQGFDYGGALHSPLYVATLRVQYGLAANYPLPEDVMGPETGAQVKQEWQLAAQFKVTESPHQYVKESRFVYSLAQRPVLRDTFPPSDAAYTQTTAFSVTQQVALEDDSFGDKGEAFAPISAFSVAQQVAVEDDEWPLPTIPVSDAVVTNLTQALVLVEEYGDPAQAMSDAVAYTVAQAVVAGDVLPDPLEPTSAVTVRLLGAAPLVADTFADPMAPNSPVDAFIVAQAVILRDTDMLRVPGRTDRRRAVVTVSIS
jgi:hypothetical protein